MTYKCPICHLEFKDAATAARCEQWCASGKSCNLEIGRLAINRESAQAEPDERFTPG